MPVIGASCPELRIVDRAQTRPIFYHIAEDAIVILEVLNKKTQTRPATTLKDCRQRHPTYLRAIAGEP